MSGTATIKDLYRTNDGARHLLDEFKQQYLAVTNQEFEIPTTAVLKVDAAKIISGEKGNNAKNPGENIILADVVYDNIRTILYSSPGKTTHIYAGLEEDFSVAVAKATIPHPSNRAPEDDECPIDPNSTFRQQVIGALTSGFVLDNQPR